MGWTENGRDRVSDDKHGSRWLIFAGSLVCLRVSAIAREGVVSGRISLWAGGKASAMASLQAAVVAGACGLSSAVVLAENTVMQASCSPASSASMAVCGRYPSIVCGRGDKRTAKGKRFRGSFGNCRPKDSSKGSGLAVTPLPPRPKKKDPFDDGEYIHIDIDESLFTN